MRSDGFPDADLPMFGLNIYGTSSSQAFHMTAIATNAVTRPKELHESVPKGGRANCLDLIQTGGFSSFWEKAHAEQEVGGPERYCEGFSDPHRN